jgi:hypothetical protein
LFLVTEVENLKPFSSDERKSAQIWKEIAKIVETKFNRAVTYIAVQRRFNSLLADFKKQDFKNRNK